MITRLVSAIIGLLAFAGCIVGGMVAGNEFDAIIVRAIKGLLTGCVVGWIAGKCCEVIVRENFRELVHSDAAEEIEQARLEAAADAAYVDATHAGQDAAGDGRQGRENVVPEALIDQDVHENDREQGNSGPVNPVSDVQDTFAAKAARELLGDVFKK